MELPWPRPLIPRRPARGPGGRVIAAVSVSGPIERLTRSPGRLHAPVVCRAGEKITELLRRSS